MEREENAKVYTEEEKVAQAEQLINDEIARRKANEIKKWVKRGALVVGGVGIAALAYKVIKDQPGEIIEVVESVVD